MNQRCCSTSPAVGLGGRPRLSSPAPARVTILPLDRALLPRVRGGVRGALSGALGLPGLAVALAMAAGDRPARRSLAAGGSSGRSCGSSSSAATSSRASPVSAAPGAAKSFPFRFHAGAFVSAPLATRSARWKRPVGSASMCAPRCRIGNLCPACAADVAAGRSPFPSGCGSPSGSTGGCWVSCDKTEHNAVGRFPEPGDGDLLTGPSRNFQVFDPLDFLAEVTQHIPDPGAGPGPGSGRFHLD
jgi:hypothetical protein